MTPELPPRARYGVGILLVLLAAILPPVPAAARGQAAAAPEAGATLLRENDFVAIWDVTRAPDPAAPAAPRTLAADQVSVTLAAGAVRITRPDGAWTVEHEPFGFVRFEPAGTVRAVEAVEEASRVVVFQLKSAPLPRWPRVADVPGQFPRAGARRLLETDRIRVWDQTWTPDVRIALHMHYVPTAAVFLEGGRLQTFEADGRPNPPFGRSRGDVLALAAPLAAPHEEEQVEGRPRAVWIEFKQE